MQLTVEQYAGMINTIKAMDEGEGWGGGTQKKAKKIHPEPQVDAAPPVGSNEGEKADSNV